MKAILKKLNNFRLASLVYAAVAVFGVIVTVLYFVAYQTTNHFTQKDQTITTNAFPRTELVGMIFFISAILAVILGIVVIALAWPYIMPKDKGTPSKALGYVLAAQAVFVLVLVALSVVELVADKGKDFASPAHSFKTENVIFWIIDMVLGVIFVGAAGCMLLPTLKCDFYCPELVAKKKKESK